MNILSIVISAFICGFVEAAHSDDVTYYLYTKANPTKNDILQTDKLRSLRNVQAVVFLIHGWTQNHTTEWYQLMKDAYLSRTDVNYNVIEVDWSGPARARYVVAVEDTYSVGKLVGDFVIKLETNAGINVSNIEITGHSLGGQVAGFAGKHVKKITGRKLKRITALDPAGPLYNFRPPKLRLCKGDATVVVVIHTDAGGFGFSERCGTIDFWPNGGKSVQPGCPEKDDVFYCSHHRSWRYFVEATETGKFFGTKCSSYMKFMVGKCDRNEMVNFGGEISSVQRGNYYTSTEKESPFAKN